MLNGVYFLFSNIYNLIIRAIAPFHQKARLMVAGRAITFRNLMERNDLQGAVWIHTASLGEFEQARPVIEVLKASGSKVVVSFFSPSGYEVRKNYSTADIVFYLPSDKATAFSKIMDHLRPKAVIITKYDFWMNMLKVIKRHETPLLLIAAVIRYNSYFKRLYYKTMLSYFNFIYTQDETSMKNVKLLGLENVITAGDTRIDRVLDVVNETFEDEKIDSFASGDRAVLVAGSVWKEDIEVLASWYKENQEVKIIIAPHEVGEASSRVIEKYFSGKKVCRYSLHKPDVTTDILILDTIGILNKVYRYGQVAFVGGGFKTGLHNILEPAAYGIPVFFGRKKSAKFIEVNLLDERGCVFPIDNAEEMKKNYRVLTQVEYASIKSSLNSFFRDNRGVSQHIIDHSKQHHWL